MRKILEVHLDNVLRQNIWACCHPARTLKVKPAVYHVNNNNNICYLYSALKGTLQGTINVIMQVHFIWINIWITTFNMYSCVCIHMYLWFCKFWGNLKKRINKRDSLNFEGFTSFMWDDTRHQSFNTESDGAFRDTQTSDGIDSASEFSHVGKYYF